MAKKKGTIDMGKAPLDKEYWEAYRWCVRNNIYISPKAKSATHWHIDITNNGKTNTSPEAYTKNVIWEKLLEYCKYYHEKHRK